LSFEVFVQCFERGEPAGVPRAAVRPLFPVVEGESEPDYWAVRYDDLNSRHIGVRPLASEASLVESLCVHRPCGDARLWDTLLAVLRLGSLVLYYPGNAPPLVASESVWKHLPADMVEAMGPPRTVRSGQEIVEAIQHP
jgi:hypothetical protein